MVSNFTEQHNLSIPVADHHGQLFKIIFPDSQIATSYACSKTKTFCIINKAFQPYYHKQTIDYCKNHPFTVGHDGSNDTHVQKMNPIAVRIFDINRSKTISEHFYSMSLTDSENSGKAHKIFEKIDSIFQSDGIPWQNCASSSVDITNVMVGKRNSVGSKFLEKNPVFIGGCPCHFAHIAASNTNDAFSKCIVLNVGDVCMDCYYWAGKTTKSKGKLMEYFDFCDQEYQTVLKHLCVRWLSLEKCAVRVLKKFPSLKSYFLSEHFSDGRFQRLNEWFSDPLLEPALFAQAATSIFTNFNLILQREEPTLHILKSSIERIGRKIANRIVKSSFLKNITSVAEID